MNLDDLNHIQRHDAKNMLAEIDDLPNQLEKAWELGMQTKLPKNERTFKQLIITGMGGSAIGADLLAAYVQASCNIPVFIHRDYGLPAFAKGPETLIIASSHSGNTEETLDAFHAAQKASCSIVVVTTGGALAEQAEKVGLPLLIFHHQGMPRAAVGFSFGLLLALFNRLGLIANVASDLEETCAAMRTQQENLKADVPAAQNPAKRLAGQLIGHWVNVMASGSLAPVARRWKGQINEMAKAGAGFEALPEADHNTLAGLLNPEEILTRTHTLFLHCPSDHPRNRRRLELTAQMFLLEGLRTDSYEAKGKSTLAHIWTALHFGDYLAFYLAMGYGVDPTPVAILEDFKKKMQSP